MKLLFCFGSNGPAQLNERLGRKVDYTSAYAPDWKRVFRGWSNNWGGGVASLDKGKGFTTYGIAAVVDNDDLDTMDIYEGVRSGNYKRSTLKGFFYSPEDDDYLESKMVFYKSLSREFNEPTKAYLRATVKTINAGWTSSTGDKVKISDIPIR